MRASIQRLLLAAATITLSMPAFAAGPTPAAERLYDDVIGIYLQQRIASLVGYTGRDVQRGLDPVGKDECQAMRAALDNVLRTELSEPLLSGLRLPATRRALVAAISESFDAAFLQQQVTALERDGYQKVLATLMEGPVLEQRLDHVMRPLVEERIDDEAEERMSDRFDNEVKPLYAECVARARG